MRTGAPRSGRIVCPRHGRLPAVRPPAAGSRRRSPYTTSGWQAHPELYAPRRAPDVRGLFPWVLRRADAYRGLPVHGGRPDAPGRCLRARRSTWSTTDSTRPWSRGGGVRARVRRETRPTCWRSAGCPREKTRAASSRRSCSRRRGGRSRDIDCLITGTSLDSGFVAGRGLPPSVQLLGYVEKAELRRTYAGAAAFLYPGIYEGFGLPIVEAMACGAPVVIIHYRLGAGDRRWRGRVVDPSTCAAIEAGIEQATLPREAQRLPIAGLRAGSLVRLERCGRRDDRSLPGSLRLDRTVRRVP